MLAVVLTRRQRTKVGEGGTYQVAYGRTASASSWKELGCAEFRIQDTLRPSNEAGIHRQELCVSVEQRESAHVHVLGREPDKLHTLLREEIQLRMRHGHTLGRPGRT